MAQAHSSEQGLEQNPGHREPGSHKAYLVGGGMASLAAAAFLIKDGGVAGKNIFIFEDRQKPGGSLEAEGSPEKGYRFQGGRMLDQGFHCTFELLSFIPSLADSTRTVKQEILEFHQDFFWNDRVRLVNGGKVLDISSLGFSTRDRLDLAELFAIPEDMIWKKRIEDWFKPAFFQTPFWYLWASSFSFEPRHSVIEFKRYLLRFVHLFAESEQPTSLFRTQYNHYDSIVRPLVRWLAERGVNFEMDVKITDLDFKPKDKEKTVQRIRYRVEGRQEEIQIMESDLVFVTLGSMTADAAFGTMEAAPQVQVSESGGAWSLWQNLSIKFSDFGQPQTFTKNRTETQWEGFTVTSLTSKFFELFQQFTHEGTEEAEGDGGFVTVKDSNWMLSIYLSPQPHFYDQPQNVWVWWGCGLYPERKGNFVHKKMTECSGREILTEVLSHFRFMDEMLEVLNSSVCIPCVMPSAGSPFAARDKGDRPAVVPKGSTNLALIGQFCEVPHEVAGTVEYSVRSAQMAVYQLLQLEKPVPALNKGYHDVGVLFKAFKAINKGPRKREPPSEDLNV